MLPYKFIVEKIEDDRIKDIFYMSNKYAVTGGNQLNITIKKKRNLTTYSIPFFIIPRIEKEL